MLYVYYLEDAFVRIGSHFSLLAFAYICIALLVNIRGTVHLTMVAFLLYIS